MVSEGASCEEVINNIGIYITIAFSSAFMIMGSMVYSGYFSSTMTEFMFIGASLSVVVALLAFAIWRYPY